MRGASGDRVVELKDKNKKKHNMEAVEEASDEGSIGSREYYAAARARQRDDVSEDGESQVSFFNEGQMVPEQAHRFQSDRPEKEATTMASHYPQIDVPLRIEAPSQLKAPNRIQPKTREQSIRELAFSPQAFVKRQQEVMPLLQEDNPNELPPPNPLLNSLASGRKVNEKDKQWSGMEAACRTQIKDLTTLAQSSKRGNRVETEALAYYSLGVLYDNMGMLHKAIEAYQNYLEAAQKMRDPVQEALAYNCLGVNCMHLVLGDQPLGGQELKLSHSGKETLQQAHEYHNRHLLITDEGGKCVAHTNLGLCQAAIGNYPSAAKHHQEALRMALKTQSLAAQGLAVGNLGLLASRQGDASTAKACLEQHLQLVQGLRDVAAEVNAWTALGRLASGQGDPSEAARCYEQAAHICQQNGEFSTLKRLNCRIGIAKGNLMLKDFMKNKMDEASQLYL